MADYKFKTVHNQADIILRRRWHAIEVYEKDRVTSIEADQRQHAQRFLNNLRRSETLVKEQESTKTKLFTKRHAHGTMIPCNEKKKLDSNKKTRPSSCPGRHVSSEPREFTRYKDNEETHSRVYSARLQEINKRIDVPFVKLSSYTKEDLKRPATALELKRKVWEKMSDYFETNNDFRFASKTFVARCASNVPRNVQLARDKLYAFTNLSLLSRQIPPTPPRVDVAQAQSQRRDLEKIERKVVREFCESLDPLKTRVSDSFGWMDVSEVYSKNAEVKIRVLHQVSDNPRKIKQREAKLVRMRKNGAVIY